jgi:uncharacterized cupredoxin-like copper-binding protein
VRTRLLTVTLVFLLAGAGLAACGATAATTSTPTVTVDLTDAGITASQATFGPGARCHFVVTNHGTQPRQFWVMPQNMQQMMSTMPMSQWRQHLLYSAQTIASTQTIAPGQTVTFDYTFPMTSGMMGTPQGLAFGCYTEQGQSLHMMPIQIRGS